MGAYLGYELNGERMTHQKCDFSEHSLSDDVILFLR